MSGADAGKAPGSGFDHGPEAVTAQGALLVQVGANLLQSFIGQGFVQQCAICGRAFGGCRAEVHVSRVGG